MSDTNRAKMVHSTYFVLAKPDDPAFRQKFVDACVKYLSGHPNQLSFSIGDRALNMNRDVNDLKFDVAMDMVFESYEGYQEYLTDPRHEEFIKGAGSMSPSRRVFDSYTRYSK